MKKTRKRKFRRLVPVFVGTYACDFGKRHDVQEVCRCSKEHGIAPIVFKSAVASLYPGVAPKDLQPHQIRHAFENIFGH